MKIKALRESFGMTQRELAERVGVNQPSVCAWERGDANPSVENLQKLADIFHCTTDEVLGRQNKQG